MSRCERTGRIAFAATGSAGRKSCHWIAYVSPQEREGQADPNLRFRDRNVVSPSAESGDYAYSRNTLQRRNYVSSNGDADGFSGFERRLKRSQWSAFRESSLQQSRC